MNVHENELWDHARGAVRSATPEIVQALVAQIHEAWCGPILQDGSSIVEPPKIDTSAVAPGELSHRIARILQARALGLNLSKVIPSSSVLGLASRLASYVEWDDFIDAVGLWDGGTRDAWVAHLASTDTEDYIDAEFEPYRERLRQTVVRWQEKPRFLERFGYSTLGRAEGYQTGLAMLRRLSPSTWFSALRDAPVRAEVEHAVLGLAHNPEELLGLLAQAPHAFDGGVETGDIAALVLAETAWSYPERLRSLDFRVGDGGGVQEDGLEDKDREWFERVQAVFEARGDGKELVLGLALKKISERIRAPHIANGFARVVQQELENHVARRWRNDLPQLSEFLDSEASSDFLTPLERWFVFARVALDDVGDVDEGATESWSELVRRLVQDYVEGSIRLSDPAPANLLVHAGFSLAQLGNPEQALREFLGDLTLERQQVHVGIQDDSEIPLKPARTRIVILAAAYALPEASLSDGFWDVLLQALRELWLGAAAYEESEMLVQEVLYCAARAISEHGDTEPQHRERFIEAAKLLKPNIDLTCSVALSCTRLWSAPDVLSTFAEAGIDLHDVCAELLDPEGWSASDEAEELHELIKDEQTPMPHDSGNPGEEGREL